MNLNNKRSLIFSAMLTGVLITTAKTTVLAKEESIRVEGTIEPMLMDLSVPSTFSFNINPNDANENYFTSSEYTLSNRSSVPLKVSITQFESSKETGVHQFNDVLPSEHTNWLGLSESLTMKDFALGLKVANPSEWVSVSRTDTIWAKEVQDSLTPIEIGVMPNETGNVHFTLEAKHGLKFSKKINPVYDISLLFEFVEE